ncbi:NAD(P)/FAD-dependent oxidoreductase [Carnobacterium alterfunditum]|uniref:NAD(P)/FAD-dependent oxidoreductase n=1 Tax=Carnobacterium alterfunditum TaxID=28230 RepID=UPI00359312A2
MKIRINELKFDLNEALNETNLYNKIMKKTKLRKDQITSYTIVRESIDARKGLTFSYVVDIESPKSAFLIQNGFGIAPEPFEPIDIAYKKELKALSLDSIQRPIVIGFGPAGIFAALQLARAGLKPIVLEMGDEVDRRQQSVEEFWETGKLNLKSNVQFGEGGAGAFSDGKLTTRIKDQRIEFVLNYMVKAGAPPEIIYKNKPHIGTDILCDVVKKLRQEILSLNGEIFFNTKVTDFNFENGIVKCEDERTYQSKYIVLAIGHSARDLFYKLESLGVSMSQKPFAMGVRIEHPQKLINVAQYGKSHSHEKLGAAEYKLTYSASNGRSVYSFCMCPGGRVVASASEENRLVVNGMSYHSRALQNANSALLVNIAPSDFGSEHVLAGVELQRQLEALAFNAGGGGYSAPVEKLDTFLGSDSEVYSERFAYNLKKAQDYYQQSNVDYDSEMTDYEITYTPEVKLTSLGSFLPEYMLTAMKEAIIHFGRQIPGFDDPRVVLTAIESRSSSPIRIIRNPETLVSISHSCLYPCGEGAGYAGGITSSAVDGVKVAEEIIKLILRESSHSIL